MASPFRRPDEKWIQNHLQRDGRLIDGVDRLPVEFRHHSAWIKGRQNLTADSPVRADPTFTTPGSLAIPGGLQELTRNRTRAAGFLKSRTSDKASVIDLFSLPVSAFVQLGGGPDIR
jgi:hypothetical protein